MSAPILSRDSLGLGDTLTISWSLPASMQSVAGPRATDTLLVFGPESDSAAGGVRWMLQPLAAGRYGGDTLVALSVGSPAETLRATVPPFVVASARTPTDTAIAAPAPMREIPVPFPWIALGSAALGVLAAIALWAYLRRRARRPVARPVGAPPPPTDPVAAARARIDELGRDASQGRPAREIAYEAGGVLRDLHGALFGLPFAAEATSREWLAWSRVRLDEAGAAATGKFLASADVLRYAGRETKSDDVLADAARCIEHADAFRKAPSSGDAH